MKNNLFVLFICFQALAQVPNTTTFAFSSVKTELETHCNCTITGLAQAFTQASAGAFDNAYSGTKNSQLNFRNYNYTAVNYTLQVVEDYTNDGNGNSHVHYYLDIINTSGGTAYLAIANGKTITGTVRWLEYSYTSSTNTYAATGESSTATFSHTINYNGGAGDDITTEIKATNPYGEEQQSPFPYHTFGRIDVDYAGFTGPNYSTEDYTVTMKADIKEPYASF